MIANLVYIFVLLQTIKKINMSAKLISLLTLILLSSFVSSANFKISGIIVDNQKSLNIEYVNIQLLNSDSVFVKGVVSSEKGEFVINDVEQGDYIICTSFVGYQNSYISITNLTRDIDLGEITLYNSSISLKEVAVTASTVIKKVDRQVILPTKKQIKASSNGLTLLRNLQLSRIIINPIDNSIKIPGGDLVQLRINGVEVTQAEVIGLKPSEIIKIEYHDNPGLRYNNAGAVIDYIVKRKEDGGNIAGDFTNGISNLGYGENHFSGKYNYLKSEFSTNVYWGRRNLKWNRENHETFILPDRLIERVEIGEPTKVKFDDINFALNYNLQEPEKYLFNIRFRNNHNNTPNSTGDRVSTLYQDVNSSSISDRTSLKSNIPALDIYFQTKLRNKQQLIFNLVGTYLNTKNVRNYTELSAINKTLISSKIRGEKYSLIAEAIYEKHLETGKLSGGIKHTQSHLENKYSEDINNFVEMNTAETHGYAEYQLNKGKFNYVFGLGGVRIYHSQKENHIEKYIFRPSLTISYHIQENLYLRYNSYISGYSPSLSDLNNISQAIDSYQIRKGNPNLKTVTYNSNDITVSWQKNKVALELFGRYSYDRKPVMEEVYLENDKFIRSTNNHKGFHRINLQASIQYLPYQEYIAIKLTPFFNRYISYGNTYTHTHTNIGFRGSLMAMYKNWTFIAEMNTSNHLLWGETLTKEEKLHSFNVGYNKEKWTISAGVLNPFTKRYQIEIENLSEIAPYKQIAYSTKLSPIFMMNFTFNLDFGRSYNAGNQKINNQDIDPGILSGKK